MRGRMWDFHLFIITVRWKGDGLNGQTSAQMFYVETLPFIKPAA